MTDRENIDVRFGPKARTRKDEDASTAVLAEIEVKVPGLFARIKLKTWKPLSDFAKRIWVRAQMVFDELVGKSGQATKDRELERRLRKRQQDERERDGESDRKIAQQRADDQSVAARAAALKDFADTFKGLKEIDPAIAAELVLRQQFPAMPAVGSQEDAPDAESQTEGG